MSERIVFADGTSFPCPEQPQAPVHPYPDRKREWRRITVIGEMGAVKGAFVDGAVYRQEWDSQVTTEDGSRTTETVTEDLSAYSVAGDLVDARDGNITVYMGKPTELELAQEQLAAAEAAMLEGVNSIG